MGISQLLREMKGVMEKKYPMENMRGKKCAVDVSGWFHKVMHIPTISPVGYVCGKLSFLRLLGVNPVVVFDGADLPAKEEVLEARRKTREKNKRDAETLMIDGKEKEAERKILASGQRTSEMVERTKKFCRSHGFSFIQAPYEADAQIAFMVKSGLVDFVITEDADFIALGCPKILFKWKKDAGGVFFQQSMVEDCWGAPYDEDNMRAVCILMGCDYLKGGLPGFGPAAARKIYPKLPRPFNYDEMMSINEIEVPAGFKERFSRAENVFKYQLVYDPESNSIKPLTPYPIGKKADDFRYAGDSNKAQKDHFFPEKRSYKPDIGLLVDYFNAELFFPCKRCELVFQSDEYLNAHFKTDHLIKCSVCSKIFGTFHHLERHIRHQHENYRPFACEICKRAFHEAGGLRDHILCHANEKKFKCVQCDRGFNTKQNLAIHMNTFHSTEKRYACSFPSCGKAFKRKRHLDDHEGVHLEERPYMCDKCGMCFKIRSSLDHHTRWHYAPKLHNCSHCRIGFTFKKHMRRHEKECIGEMKETPFKCHLCREDFFTQNGKSCLWIHKCCRVPNNALSKVDENPTLPHDEEKPALPQDEGNPHKCSVCGKGFKWPSEVTKHMVMHTGEKRFRCEKCGEGFPRANALKSHLLIHTGEKPHKCHWCARAFALPCNLKKHLKSCKMSSTNINKHKLVHTSLKKYICGECSKSFRFPTQLDDHMRTHTGEKPFKCLKCEKGFAVKGNLTAHLKNPCKTPPKED